MKALWIRAVLLAGVMVGAVGCNNTIGTVGFPTISINNGVTALTFDPDKLRWKGQIQAVFYALPGSPGGTIRFLTAQSGAILQTGVYIPKCDVPTTVTPPVQNCGPYSFTWAWDSPSYPARADWTVVSYTAEGDNGIPSSRQLGVGQPLI
jgi:hypothetical protein